MTHALDSAELKFVPPYCPDPSCIFHRRTTGWRWVRDGVHRRKAKPLLVQRFRCLRCRRSFSTQTFRTTYYLKRPELQPRIFRLLVTCAGYRQLGEAVGCVHSTVLNQARRLGRHCLLFQHVHAPPAPPEEPLVLDGLRTFEYSQYWPFDLNHVTGQTSHFIYGFNHAPLRRSGSMKPRQKKRRKQLETLHGRPNPKATQEQVEALLRRITEAPCAITLVSDEHRAYVTAVKRMKGWTVKHERVSSKAARTPKNPLWTANLADLLVRHGGANHKRETIAFSKRAQGALARMAVFQVTRNFIGGVRVRDGKASPSPAMELKLKEKRLEVEEVLAERLVPSRVRLPDELEEMYREEVPTRQLQNPRRHELKYAA